MGHVHKYKQNISKKKRQALGILNCQFDMTEHESKYDYLSEFNLVRNSDPNICNLSQYYKVWYNLWWRM